MSRNVSLDYQYSKLTSKLLDLAADEFANHGCNDFDLASVVPSLEERHRLMKDVCTQLGSDYDPDCDYATVEDWVLMRYLARSLP